MKNLIEEKLKEIQDLCELTEEKYQINPKGFLVDNYLRIQDDINSYNLITAPKQIKLSEIVNRLQETIKGKLSVEEGMWCEKAIGYYVRTWEDYDFDELVGFDKEMKITHIALKETDFKWLYTLWIAGTEIIDDLECDE